MNTCMRCGACCACFRVVFSREEADDMPGGVIPVEFTVPAGTNKLAMRGTEGANLRCSALEGNVGFSVHCSLYTNRPSTCRNFIGNWETSVTNTFCDRARAYFGLPPFDPY